MSLSLIFMIIALVLFVLAAANVSAPRVNLIALGLAFWIAAAIFGGTRVLAVVLPVPMYDHELARDD